MSDRQAIRKHLRRALEKGERRQRLEIGGIAIEVAIIGRKGHCADSTALRRNHSATRSALGDRIDDPQGRKAKSRKPTKVRIIAAPLPAATNSGRIAGVTATPTCGAKTTQAE